MRLFLQFFALAALASPAFADTTAQQWWYPDVNLRPAAYGYLAASTGTVAAAAYKMTDGTLCQVLVKCASSGQTVGLVVNASAGTAAISAALAIAHSGVTVTLANFSDVQANNFLAITGTGTASLGAGTIYGSYRWSPTQVQPGTYLQSTVGTTQVAANLTTYATLISGGTIAAHSTILHAPPLEAPTVIYAANPTPKERPRFVRRAMVLPRARARLAPVRTVRDPLGLTRLAGSRTPPRRGRRRSLQQCPQCQYGNCQQQLYRPVDNSVGYQDTRGIGPPPPPSERPVAVDRSTPVELGLWTRPRPEVCQREGASCSYPMYYADPFHLGRGRYQSAGLVPACEPAAGLRVPYARGLEAWTPESPRFGDSRAGWLEVRVRLRLERRIPPIRAGLWYVEPARRSMPFTARQCDSCQ